MKIQSMFGFGKKKSIIRDFQCIKQFKHRSVQQSCNLKVYMIKKCYISEVYLHKIFSIILGDLVKDKIL